MSDPAAAAEHLKLIRGMMERATVYRAISAPAAIFGGVLGAVTGGYFFIRGSGEGSPVRGAEFFWIWVAVLALVSLFNVVLLWRKSRSGGEKLWSPGMKLACLSLAPTLLVGGVLSYSFAVDYDEFVMCVVAWTISYGAALLAMGGVAPRSIKRLGRMFLVGGILIFVAWRVLGAAVLPQLGLAELQAAAVLMMVTFGFLHLVHGVGVMVRKGGDGEPV